MSGEIEFVSSVFDIFAHKPVQLSILGTDVVHCKPIATVDQNDLEFLIPGDSETYIDQDINLYVSGKIFCADGKDLDASDFTAGTNNFVSSQYSQCSISLNGVNITPASELYPYRSYLESLDLWFRRRQFASYKRVLLSGRRGRLGRGPDIRQHQE